MIAKGIAHFMILTVDVGTKSQTGMETADSPVSDWRMSRFFMFEVDRLWTVGPKVTHS